MAHKYRNEYEVERGTENENPFTADKDLDDYSGDIAGAKTEPISKIKSEVRKNTEKRRQSEYSEYVRDAEQAVEQQLGDGLSDAERVLSMKPSLSDFLSINRKYFDAEETPYSLFPNNNSKDVDAVEFLKFNNANYIKSVTEFETPY